MKILAAVLVLLAAVLTCLSSTAKAKAETPCEAQRVVEMRNAVMAAHLLCKQVITGQMYDDFIIRNRKRIAAANSVAVTWHMKKYGSRAKFDALDSHVMNSISMVSSKNPSGFCERMEAFKPLVQSLSVDDLLKKQTQLELPTCD
jgi:hypothetical protein